MFLPHKSKSHLHSTLHLTKTFQPPDLKIRGLFVYIRTKYLPTIAHLQLHPYTYSITPIAHIYHPRASLLPNYPPYISHIHPIRASIILCHRSSLSLYTDAQRCRCRGAVTNRVRWTGTIGLIICYITFRKVMCYIGAKLPLRVAPLTPVTHKLVKSVQANVRHTARVGF